MYVGVGCERKSAKKIARSGLRPLENAKRRLEVVVDLMRVVQSGPACEMCKDYYYYLNTGEATTEPHKSQMYEHESLKVQNGPHRLKFQVPK